MKHFYNLIVICIAAILCIAFTTDGTYTNYCNSRFQFCVDYPKELVAQSESTNGDGQVFLSKDKQTEVRAYGSMAIEDFDKIQQQYEMAVTDIKISYKVIKATWFIISGTDKKGQIIYRKTVKKKLADYMNGEPQDVFQTLMITYPASQKEIYNSYCGKIAKSL